MISAIFMTGEAASWISLTKNVLSDFPARQFVCREGHFLLLSFKHVFKRSA